MANRLTKVFVFHIVPPVAFFVLITFLIGKFSPFILSGLLLSTFLFDLDHLLYALVMAPEDAVSIGMRERLVKKDFYGMFDYVIGNRHDFVRLTLHNALFQLVLVVLVVYVLSSSGSHFAKGFVIGMFLHSLVDQVGDFVRVGNINPWFWMLGQTVPLSWQKVYFLTTLFLLFFLLLLF